ncbi:AAA family ATPase [Candidatus Woesebacteria bacterium]|nr:AAA family ATPase [Candidatus Woesebacteria bacterium]
MIITGLWLQHFRNISDHTWSFEPGLNVFTAPNGSGKSNLIESLALLSTGQSWRAKQTDELIEWDEELARVMAKFQDEKRRRNQTRTTLYPRYSPRQKKRISVSIASTVSVVEPAMPRGNFLR